MPKSKVHREDGLLSAQMLNGIPEVDLGIKTKISKSQMDYGLNILDSYQDGSL